MTSHSDQEDPGPISYLVSCCCQWPEHCHGACLTNWGIRTLGRGAWTRTRTRGWSPAPGREPRPAGCAAKPRRQRINAGIMRQTRMGWKPQTRMGWKTRKPAMQAAAGGGDGGRGGGR